MPWLAELLAFSQNFSTIRPRRKGYLKMAATITPGATIYTADGKLLGTVKKLEANAFQVDAPRQLDYWLEVTLVGTADESRIELTVHEADLGAYKMDRPNDHNAFQEPHPKSIDPATVRGQQLQR